jgi:S1-C subfamily serine protease
VCISADGYVLTNHHVVAGKERWLARHYGKQSFFQADVVGRDPAGDVALLKLRDVGEALPHAEFADLAGCHAGQWVLALGDPFKLAGEDGAPSISLGTLSGFHRYQGDPARPTSPSLYTDALQTDAAVNPGNSGGPLFSTDGKLLGLTGQIMARFTPRTNSGIAYAVPADQLRRFLPLLKEARGGLIYRGTLPSGLQLADAPAQGTAPRCVKIEALGANSPAESAGFRQGDRVVKVNGQAAFSVQRALGLVQSWPEGTPLELELLRGSERVTLRLKLPRLEIP